MAEEIENWAQAQIDRINAEKKRRLESLDLTLTQEEQERRKRAATETDIQT